MQPQSDYKYCIFIPGGPGSILTCSSLSEAPTWDFQVITATAADKHGKPAARGSVLLLWIQRVAALFLVTMKQPGIAVEVPFGATQK